MIAILFSVIFTTASALAQQEAGTPPSISPETVMANCSRSQKYLENTTKPSDRRSRVDRLQAYRYMVRRIDNLVKRLENNQQPKADSLRKQLTDLSSLIDKFKSDYETYDNARESVIKLDDCEDKVEEFNEKLAEARQARAVVAADVVKINNYLNNDMTNELKALQKELQITGTSGGSR